MSATGSVIVMSCSSFSPGFVDPYTGDDLGGSQYSGPLGVRPDARVGRTWPPDPERCVGHYASCLKGNPKARSNARPSSSVLAVVTIVISKPRTRSILSWLISWNTLCSWRPNV